MMKTRFQTILLIIITTLTVSVLLFAELVTSAGAGDQVGEPDITSSANSTNSTDAFTIFIGINPVGSGQINIGGTSYSNGDSVPISTDVSLTPVYDLGYWRFAGWSGTYVTTTSPLDLFATQDYNVTANFVRSCHALTLGYTDTVGGAAGANPTASPASAFCGPGQYAADETINLDAAWIDGWRVAGWTGTLLDSSTAYTNTALMNTGAHEITVRYEPVCYDLTTNINPSGTGTVSRNQAPNCPIATPGNKYHKGTTVFLTAKPQLGYDFTLWSGNVNPINNKKNPLDILMDSNRNITANFELGCHKLTLTHIESGSDPGAFPEKSPECESKGEYVADEKIDLSATPAPDWQVASWSGADNPGINSETNVLTFPKLLSGADGHIVTVKYVKKPTLLFSAAKYLAPENIGQAKITVRRTGSLSETVEVDYATSPGTAKAGQDYEATSGKLTFPPTIVEKSFYVTIKNDNIKEGDENLFVTLSKPKDGILGTPFTAEIVIQDNEGEPTLQFSTETFEVDEFSSTATITVTLFPASSNLVYVKFDTMAMSATSGDDYGQYGVNQEISQEITFVPGNPTSKQVVFNILDDTLDEPAETVQLKLSNNIGAALGNPEAVLTINDDDLPPTVQFSESEYYVKEGESPAPVTITLSAASALSVTLDYEVIELTVGRQFADVVIFEPGETSKTVDIPINDYQMGDRLNIILTTADNATLAPPASAVMTILDPNRSECHRLTLQKNGYGILPLTTNIEHSLGCADGYFVAGELIDVLGQPNPGWKIDRWHGTENPGTSLENVVRMPNSDHTVTIYYITFAYLPTIMHQFVSYFEGPQEIEPNNGLGVSEANGPIRSGQPYFGRFPSANDQFDIYYFYLTGKRNVQVELVNIPDGRDYNLYLYSADKVLKGYSGNLDESNEHISSSKLEPGVYFVAIDFGESAPTSSQYKVTAIYE